MSAYNVLGLGQPLLDRILQVDEAVMQRLGIKERGGSSLILDKSELEVFLKSLEAAISEEYCSGSSSSDEEDEEPLTPLSPIVNKNAFKNIKKALLVPGGSCCNTIKAMASLGEKCGLIGKLGRDSSGRYYRDSMSDRGVIPLMIEDAHHRTGEVICLITPNGERTMKAFLGASLQMTENDLLPQDFQGVKLLHVEGYSIYNQPLTFRAMELAKQNQSMVSFDLGSFELVRQFKPTILNMLKNHVDIVFANSEEARELIGESKDAKVRDVAEKCADYLAQYCKVAVVMMGKEGCWVKSGNEKYACPADVVANPIDTTGAGDLFAAGFLYGYLQGYTLQQCARLGSLSGCEVVKVLGAEVPMERFKTIKAHVNSQVFMSSLSDKVCSSVHTNSTSSSLFNISNSPSASISQHSTTSGSLKIKKVSRRSTDMDAFNEDGPILSGSFKKTSGFAVTNHI